MKKTETEDFTKKVGADTEKKIQKKTTTSGVIKQLNTLQAIREIYNSPDVVLAKIYQARLVKTDSRCPKCNGLMDKFYRKVAHKLAYSCKICNNKIHPLVGTPLERSHVKLNLIIEFLHRMITSPHGLTAAEVARDYGLKDDSAHKTLQRIRTWMGLYMSSVKFEDNSIVEMDEVYVKVPTGLGRRFKWSRGLGSERLSKTITMAQRGGIVKGFVVEEVNGAVVDKLLKDNANKTIKVRTDEKNIYHHLSNADYDHVACNHGKKEWVNGDAHTNTCEGLHSFIKGSIYTVHKGVQHTQKYVDETTFRFSHRFNKNAHEAIQNLFEALPPLFEQKQPLKKVA